MAATSQGHPGAPHSPTNFPTPPQTRPPGQPGQPTPPQQRQAYPPYQPPNSPKAVALEQKRVAVLLDINSELIALASKLQADGQSGIIPRDPAQAQALANMAAQQGGENGAAANKVASQEYIHCMRCLQSNMAWLSIVANGGKPPAAPAAAAAAAAAAAQQSGQQNVGMAAAAAAAAAMAKQNATMQGPAIMDAPPLSSDRLPKLYAKLKDLFPGWKGAAAAAAAARSGNHNASGSNVSAAGGGSGSGSGSSAGMQGNFHPSRQTPPQQQQQQQHQQDGQPSFSPHEQQHHQQQQHHNFQPHSQPNQQQPFPYNQGQMMPAQAYMQNMQNMQGMQGMPGMPGLGYGQPQMHLPPGAGSPTFPPG